MYTLQRTDDVEYVQQNTAVRREKDASFTLDVHTRVSAPTSHSMNGPFLAQGVTLKISHIVFYRSLDARDYSDDPAQRRHWVYGWSRVRRVTRLFLETLHVKMDTNGASQLAMYIKRFYGFLEFYRHFSL